MVFNTSLKSVKQKDSPLHQNVCSYSLHYYIWIFRSERNYSSNCQKGKNNTQIPGSYKNDANTGNHFCSASSFDLSAFWFLKSTPSPFQVLHPISYCQPPRRFFHPISYCCPPRKCRGRAILSCRCLFTPLSASESPNQSQLCIFPANCSALSHHMLPFPQISACCFH